MESALALGGVSKAYGTLQALKSVDLTVSIGEMFALVGPDGAGKSTLLRILSGGLNHDAGSVTILGRELPKGRKELRQQLGYLSQGFSLYRDLSIEENLRFFADLYGVEDYQSRRDQRLGFTRLDAFAGRLAGRLSGGMKKKLALACALIHRPKLLLLDEPTTGVDPVSRRDFWLILGELLETGLTIIVTSPYLDEAERCHRVGLLREGEFLFVGTPQEARESLSGSMVELVVSDPRQARRAIDPLLGAEITEAFLLGDRIHLRLPAEEPGASAAEEAPAAGPLPSAIRSRLEDGGVAVIDARKTAPTLENVYLSLIASASAGKEGTQ